MLVLIKLAIVRFTPSLYAVLEKSENEVNFIPLCHSDDNFTNFVLIKVDIKYTSVYSLYVTWAAQKSDPFVCVWVCEYVLCMCVCGGSMHTHCSFICHNQSNNCKYTIVIIILVTCTKYSSTTSDHNSYIKNK